MSGQDSGFRIQSLDSPSPSDAGAANVEPRERRGGVGVRFPVNKPEDAKAVSAAHDAAKTEYNAKKDKLKQTTQDFEAIFLGMMLKQMRKSVAGQDVLFGKSHESKMFQDMMDDTTAKNLSKAGSFGLANLLYKTMERTLPANPDKE